MNGKQASLSNDTRFLHSANRFRDGSIERGSLLLMLQPGDPPRARYCKQLDRHPEPHGNEHVPEGSKLLILETIADSLGHDQSGRFREAVKAYWLVAT